MVYYSLVLVLFYLRNGTQLTYRCCLVRLYILLALNNMYSFVNLTNGSEVMRKTLTWIANCMNGRRVYIISYYNNARLCLSPQRYMTGLMVLIGWLLNLLKFKFIADFFYMAKIS